MKLNYRTIIPSESKLFDVIIQATKEEFDFSWHYHKECELIFILNGNGNQYVGDSIETFSTDDLVLIGSNLPHCWVTESNTQEHHHPHAIVVYLKEDLFQGSWFESSEFNSIRDLIELSKRGIKFNQEISLRLKEKCLALTVEHSLKNFTLLLEILQDLSNSPKTDYRLLCKQTFSGDLNSINSERINLIFRYIENNYEKKISLKDVADKIWRQQKKDFWENLLYNVKGVTVGG